MIPTKIVDSVKRSDLSPAQVTRELLRLIEAGGRVRASGNARHNPQLLLAPKFRPKFKIKLFNTRYFFSQVLQIPELRFFICFVVQQRTARARPTIFPRLIYKDLSLAWRAASHYSIHEGEIWVGKGDVGTEMRDGEEYTVSNESTTDLPLEMQSAVERILANKEPVKSIGKSALELVLRKSPSERVEPYLDFTAPRRRAAANPGNLIHGGKRIAWFRKRNDPTSLKIVAGYEPNFESGIIECTKSRSRLYGGTLERFRILSINRKIQYYFIAGPKQVWLFPPQSFTTELSSYGVRTIDVVADDDLFIPGYEYHHFENTKNGLVLYSQIPTGFVGQQCPRDEAKADASPWLEKIPLIQEFRREVLKS